MGGFDQIDDQIFVIDDQNDQNDRIRRFEVKPFTLEARIYFIMNPSIPANLRTTVISLYLQGESRNQIASKTGISQGSVSNIVAAWKKGLEEADAMTLRDLGTMMKRAGLNPLQCASGFRMVRVLSELGVNEDVFYDYISNIHNRCAELGLDPQNVAEGIKQLLVLCESVPIWQMSDYIESKRTEKENLEKSVATLKTEEGQTRTKLQNAMDEHGITLRQIEDYRAMKSRLQKAGVQLDDLELFIKSLQGARELGYDAQEIVRNLTNLKASVALDAELEHMISDKKLLLGTLEEERSKQELVLATNHVVINKLQNSESTGFGLKDLTILSDTVKEISMAYDIPVNSAVRTFLKDIDENYELHLGYQGRCKNAQIKFNEIKRQYLSIQVALANKKKVADVLAQLLSFGYKEQEILEFAYELQPELRPTEPPATNSTGGISMDMITNMWTNLTQNKTLLQPNTAFKNEDTQDKESSQPKPSIHSQPGNRGNLQSVWHLRFSKNLELISSAGYRPAKTFEMDMKEVTEICEYSNAIKCGNIQAMSPVAINIPYQD